MTVFTRMDLKLSGLLDRVFRLGRGVQPVDLARLLRRTAMSAERRTLTASFAPNIYQVLMPGDQLEPLLSVRQVIESDLQASLQEFIASQELLATGPVRVRLERGEKLRQGQVRILAHFGGEA